MTQLRVLWLNHRDLAHPRSGGAERTIHEVTRRLAQKGHRLTVLTSAWPGAPRTAEADGVRIERVGRSIAPHFAGWLRERSDPPDVAVDDLAHVLPWGSGRWGRIPTIAYFRHLHRRTLPGQVPPVAVRPLIEVERAYPWVYRHDSFVTESRAAVDDLVRLGVPSERIARIPPGVYTERFRPGGRISRPRLVYFGGLREYKRPGESIELLRRLRDAGVDADLEVIGDGPELARLRVLARTLGVEDFVEFPGRLAEEEIPARVARASVNLHWSVAEGWGLSAMEAAAAGVPTVGYSVPGLREVVEDGRTGRLVPSGDREAACRAIQEVLDSPTRWSDPCRRMALTHDWDRVAERWERLLLDRAGGSRPGSTER